MRIEASEAEMKLKGELTESVNLVPVAAPAPKTTYTDSGSASIFKVRKWEVEDITKVPPEFLMVDAGRITKLVKAGIGSIAGIRIWEENSLRITPKTS